jgi:hypothetical protein
MELFHFCSPFANRGSLSETPAGSRSSGSESGSVKSHSDSLSHLALLSHFGLILLCCLALTEQLGVGAPAMRVAIPRGAFFF